jgi:hypothetical protein
MLDDEGAGPEQQAILRAMTPAQRWDAAVRLYWSARRLERAFVRSVHPDWPDERVDGAHRPSRPRRLASPARTRAAVADGDRRDGVSAALVQQCP